MTGRENGTKATLLVDSTNKGRRFLWDGHTVRLKDKTLTVTNLKKETTTVTVKEETGEETTAGLRIVIRKPTEEEARLAKDFREEDWELSLTPEERPDGFAATLSEKSGDTVTELNYKTEEEVEALIDYALAELENTA